MHYSRNKKYTLMQVFINFMWFMDVKNKCCYMQIPVQIVCWMNKLWAVCVVSNYCVCLRAACFEIFRVFRFPGVLFNCFPWCACEALSSGDWTRFYSTIQYIESSLNQNEYSKLKSRMSKIAKWCISDFCRFDINLPCFCVNLNLEMSS